MFIDYMAYKVSKVLMGFTYTLSCVEKPTVFPNKTSLFGQNQYKILVFKEHGDTHRSLPCQQKLRGIRAHLLQSSAKVTQILK